MTHNIAKIRAALEQATGGRPSNIAAAQAALAALAELEKAVAEPVAWQYRLDGDCEWSQCTMRGFDTLVSIGECETRQLYTTPPPAKPAMGMFTAEEAEDFYFQGFDACYNADDMGDMNWHGFWLRSKAFKLVQERTK